MTAFEIVRAVTVRLVDTPDDSNRWDELIRRHHYLGLKNMVGKTVRYVAEINGQWVALLGFASPALKGTLRDRFIGWTSEQQAERLIYIAQNTRFLILPRYHVPNLGSRVLGLALRRLSSDWLTQYGHPVLLCETFVDPSRFDGGVYNAAGWQLLGETSGYAKSGASYVEHGQPKQVWVRPLRRKACELLRKDFLPPALGREPALADPNTLPLNGPRGLITYMQAVPDPRKRRGVRHPVASVLGVAALAVICGMRSYRAIAQWAQGLTQDQLFRLGGFRSPTTGRYVAPSEATIWRTLTQVDADCLDQAVAAYLGAVLERRGPRRIALDGKTLRGSASDDRGARHLLSAVHHGIGVVLAQAEVGTKENEIPAAQRMLQTMPLEDTVVTLDAMHTQDKTAAIIVEAGGEYLFTVKDNQPSLRQSLAALDWRFPPLPDHAREGARSLRDPDDPSSAHP